METTLNAVEIILLINLSVMTIMAILGFMWGTRELRHLRLEQNSSLNELAQAAKTIAHAAKTIAQMAGVAEEKHRRGNLGK